MSNWRETKIGTGVKRPKSRQMRGSDRKKGLKEKIKKQKEKQRILLKSTSEYVKKVSQSMISIDGLETLSDSSIRSLQKRRDASIVNMSKSVQDLVRLTKSLKNTESQLRQEYQ